jgi:hypothetical protein
MNPLAQLGIALGVILILCLGSGYVGYEWKASKDKYITEAGYVKAQNAVITKQTASITTSNNIGASDDKQIQIAIDKYHADIIKLPARSAGSNLPSAACPTTGVDAAATRRIAGLKLNLQICTIKYNDWNKWYNQQSRIYNAKP